MSYEVRYDEEEVKQIEKMLSATKDYPHYKVSSEDIKAIKIILDAYKGLIARAIYGDILQNELSRDIDKLRGDFFEMKEQYEEKNKEDKNLLIDMVNQFAYEDFNPKTRGSSEQKIYTGVLSVGEAVVD